MKVEFIRLEQGYAGWKEWNESKHSSVQERGAFAGEETACLDRAHGEERLEIKVGLYQMGRPFNIQSEKRFRLRNSWRCVAPQNITF